MIAAGTRMAKEIKVEIVVIVGSLIEQAQLTCLPTTTLSFTFELTAVHT
jgi:hypothetical protein